jgi:hypothetical protein
MDPAKNVTSDATTTTDAASASAATTGLAADDSDARMTKLRHYVAQALATIDPLEAHLGLVNTDLLMLAYAMKAKILESMDVSSAAVDVTDQTTRAVDQYLRVSKQIERYAQLEIKLRNSRQQDVHNLRKAAHDPLGGSEYFAH